MIVAVFLKSVTAITDVNIRLSFKVGNICLLRLSTFHLGIN